MACTPWGTSITVVVLGIPKVLHILGQPLEPYLGGITLPPSCQLKIVSPSEHNAGADRASLYFSERQRSPGGWISSYYTLILGIGHQYLSSEEPL